MALLLLPLNTREHIQVSFPMVDVQVDSILIPELMGPEDSNPTILEEHCGIAKHLLIQEESLNSRHIQEATEEDILEPAK